MQVLQLSKLLFILLMIILEKSKVIYGFFLFPCQLQLPFNELKGYLQQKFQFSNMVNLSETQRIEILILVGYADLQSLHQDVSDFYLIMFIRK